MAQTSILYTIHGHNEAKVARLMDEMKVLGAPTIRVVDCGDHYIAIEGVHRLEAAARLGIMPYLVVLEQDELVPSDSLDLDWLIPGENYTAGELAGEVYSRGSGIYKIEDGQLRLVSNGDFAPADE